MGNEKERERHVCLLPGGDEDHLALPNWDQWMVPARDSKGHYTKIQAKFPPQLAGEIYKFIDTGLSPYRSIGYFWRNAALQHLLDLIRRHPEWCDARTSVIHAVNAMVKIVRDDEYMEDFRSVITKLEERVRDHESRGNEKRAYQLLIQVWAETDKIEDPFWKGEYQSEMRRKFARYLKQMPPEKKEKENESE